MLKIMDKILYTLMFLSAIIGIYLAVSHRLTWVG